MPRGRIDESFANRVHNDVHYVESACVHPVPLVAPAVRKCDEGAERLMRPFCRVKHRQTNEAKFYDSDQNLMILERFL